VEDDPDIQTVASLALGSLGGYNVRVCASAAEAIEVAPSYAPDLILLDVMMPGMDGRQALQALRELPGTASTPVIFLTARVQPADVAQYREMDPLAVIAKPFDPTALVDTIDAIWTRHSAQAD
jgi:CheY-like chemotaxis protein